MYELQSLGRGFDLFMFIPYSFIHLEPLLTTAGHRPLSVHVTKEVGTFYVHFII